jgi:hypothetical protein
MLDALCGEDDERMFWYIVLKNALGEDDRGAFTSKHIAHASRGIEADEEHTMNRRELLHLAALSNSC